MRNLRPSGSLDFASRKVLSVDLLAVVIVADAEVLVRKGFSANLYHFPDDRLTIAVLAKGP